MIKIKESGVCALVFCLHLSPLSAPIRCLATEFPLAESPDSKRAVVSNPTIFG
jgi:hypothetical protein